MLTKRETQELERTMRRELDATPRDVLKCAAGIVIVLAVSLAGPVIGLVDAAPQYVTAVLDHFAGIAN